MKDKQDQKLETRAIIGYREKGDIVDPVNMTTKEYISYLCGKFKFRIHASWDGVERRLYRPNYEPEESHNIETRDEALHFLGIILTPEAPDGIDVRSGDRRKKNKKINRPDKRSYCRRRKDKRNQKLDNIVHIITFVICVSVYAILWSMAQ